MSTTNTTASPSALAEGHFDRGADILRAGKIVFRVPPCTHWDDDAIRVIVRSGEAIAQIEEREISGTRSWGTGVWRDWKSLGPAEGLTVAFDDRA